MSKSQRGIAGSAKIRPSDLEYLNGIIDEIFDELSAQDDSIATYSKGRLKEDLAVALCECAEADERDLGRLRERLLATISATHGPNR